MDLSGLSTILWSLFRWNLLFHCISMMQLPNAIFFHALYFRSYSGLPSIFFSFLCLKDSMPFVCPCCCIPIGIYL